MTGPAQDGRRFLCALLLGLALGALYGFFRPLRARHPVLADALFLPFAGYAWLYLGFAVCRADLRLSYCSGLLIGAGLWCCTLGRWLFPLFYSFWKGIFLFASGFLQFFEKFFQKIYNFFKNVFAIWKKWYTIVETNHRKKYSEDGGAPSGQ